MDQKLTFQGKIEGLEDRFLDRISMKSASFIYSQYINDNFNKGFIDKKGNYTKKSMEI